MRRVGFFCLVGLSITAVGLIAATSVRAVPIDERGYHYDPAEPLSGEFASVKLSMPWLSCVEQTPREKGEDEVYIVTQWRDSFGAGWQLEPLQGTCGGKDGPADTQNGTCWSFRKGQGRMFGSDRNGGGVSIGSSFNIKPGQQGELRMILMESEQRPLKPLEDYLRRVPLGDLNGVTGADKYLGAVSWKVSYKDGAIQMTAPTALKDTRITQSGNTAFGGTAANFDFYHAGRYSARIVTYAEIKGR